MSASQRSQTLEVAPVLLQRVCRSHIHALVILTIFIRNYSSQGACIVFFLQYFDLLLFSPLLSICNISVVPFVGGRRGERYGPFLDWNSKCNVI